MKTTDQILNHIKESKSQVSLSPSEYLEAIKYKKARNRIRGLTMEDLIKIRKGQ